MHSFNLKTPTEKEKARNSQSPGDPLVAAVAATLFAHPCDLREALLVRRGVVALLLRVRPLLVRGVAELVEPELHLNVVRGGVDRVLGVLRPDEADEGEVEDERDDGECDGAHSLIPL